MYIKKIRRSKIMKKDLSFKKLSGKKIVVVGYGSQGHAHAQNLNDCGLDVTVSVRKDGPSWNQAKKDGVKVAEYGDCIPNADVVMILLPDETQPQIYYEHLHKQMKKGAYLGFAHGFNVHYNQIEPREDLNVFMTAPKSPGHKVRDKFVENEGIPALIGVYRDNSKDTWEIAEDWAKGVCLDLYTLRTSFEEETETDLFGEQAVLCGGAVALMKAGYDTLIKAGYDEKLAYFECVHELKLIVDMVYATGFESMRSSISNTAEYGDYITGPKIITEDIKKNMETVLKDIQDGKFAKDFLSDCKVGYPVLKTMRRNCKKDKIEIVGGELRAKMFKSKK
ncbi:MAG: ketol-acid reductoisomerase [Fusobacteriaceae bacterium]